MAESDTEGSFDPAALLQMDMDDNGAEYSEPLVVMDDPVIDMDNELAPPNSETPTPEKKDTKKTSFDDEKQFIIFMELANNVQVEEMEARANYFDLSKIDWQVVLGRTYSHCTICDIHCDIVVNKPNDILGHPLLKTLVCKKCFDFYGDGNFACGDDGVDMYCRWCAEGGNLFCCSNCPNAFCENCVRRNFGANELKRVKILDDWNCYICEPKLLWGHRAVLATIQHILKELKSKKELSEVDLNKDLSACCDSHGDDYVRVRKMFQQFCPDGVLIPQIKNPFVGNRSIVSSPAVLTNTRIENNVQAQDNNVNDFFANGHFLEAALPKPTPPPPLSAISQSPQPRTPVQVLSIRPKPTSSLQNPRIQQRPMIRLQSRQPTSNGPVFNTPKSLTISHPVYTNTNRPRFGGSTVVNNNIGMIRNNQPIKRPQLTSNKIVPYANHTKQVTARGSNMNTQAKVQSTTKQVTARGSNMNTQAKVESTYDWFQNLMDMALLCADFFKDEVFKLKINNLNRNANKNTNSSLENFRDIKKMAWIFNSVAEQISDGKNIMKERFPQITDLPEPIWNLKRLQESKSGVVKQNNSPAISRPVPNKVNVNNAVAIARQNNVVQSSPLNRLKQSNQLIVTQRTIPKINLSEALSNSGLNNSRCDDVVDLVSDDEDATPSVKQFKKVNYPVLNRQIQPVMSRTMVIPNNQLPGNRMTPVQNFNSSKTIVQNNKMSAAMKRKRKQKLSDDTDDDDYVPATPKRRKKRKQSFKHIKQAVPGQTNQKALPNGNSLSSGNQHSPKSPVQPLSRDIMAQVLKIDDGECSEEEEVAKDPLHDDDQDKDDWISQNPTLYEKYCQEYDLLQDCHIRLQNCDNSHYLRE